MITPGAHVQSPRRQAIRTTLLCIALTLCPLAPAQHQRMVFAHYMVTNQDYLGGNGHNEEAKIVAYEREIREHKPSASMALR